MTDSPSEAVAADLADLLHRWLPAQRWYPAKGRGVGLRALGSFVWETGPAGESGAASGAQVVVRVVGLDSGDRLDVVQVPLALRPEPLVGAEHALLGIVASPDGPRWVYDGPHDPAYVAALLHALRPAEGAAPVPPDSPSRVLAGEQSNTSIIVEPVGSAPAIVKVFRTLHAGENPDVSVLAALTRVGCPHVPALRGWLDGSWQTAGTASISGHLAVAVDFLAGGSDAWRVALDAVASDEDFGERAHGLGAATARVHADLVLAFGATTTDPATRDRTVAALQERVSWARAAVRELDPFGEELTSHAAALLDLPELPPLQRVHGDLHLGQVLLVPDRGWVLLDFEGEPLRPLSERTLPDLALRDVAGLLRSIDYAAGHGTIGRPDGAERERATAWAAATRDAYCSGYGSVTGRDPRDDAALLRALELDKALYEVVYEARNRPTWLPVPLAAVARLLA